MYGIHLIPTRVQSPLRSVFLCLQTMYSYCFYFWKRPTSQSKSVGKAKGYAHGFVAEAYRGAGGGERVVHVRVSRVVTAPK